MRNFRPSISRTPLPARAFKLPRKKKKAFLKANGSEAYLHIRLRYELRSPLFSRYSRERKARLYDLLEQTFPRFDARIEPLGGLSFNLNLSLAK